MDVTKKCIPCQGGIPKLNSDEIISFLKIDKDWKVEDDKLYKYFNFQNTKNRYILNEVKITGEEDHILSFI